MAPQPEAEIVPLVKLRTCSTITLFTLATPVDMAQFTVVTPYPLLLQLAWTEGGVPPTITGLIVKVAAAEVPAGVVTVTLAVPAVVIRLAGTAAVTWVELTKVVVSAVAPH